MNYFCFIGNLTKDPESKQIQSTGKTTCTFSVAVQREYKNDSGQHDADYFQITTYEKLAELCGKYLAKGRKVAVTGRVKTGSYEKDGRRIYTTNFIADKVEFLSAKKDSASQAAGADVNYPTPEQQGFTQVDDDELPF